MDFLTNPFTTALLLLYQFLGQNMVLAIVVFTVLVRVLTYPLTNQQIKSSKAMSELQPRLKKLQEKYKNDREKLAQEQMRLYREHGVNPMAGCLPLLIQMPVLLGLYQAISRALAATPLQVLDLHHRIMIPGLSDIVPLQNHFLWLDLGQPDPIYILPVLVVATTWLQSKLMTPPPSGDPKDPSAAMSRNMTVMMPLMIGIFSLQFASGLSLYWVVSNLAGIAQYAMLGQLHVGNLFGRKAPATVGFQPANDEEDAEEAPSTSKKSLPAPANDDKPRKGRPRPVSPTRKTKTSRAK